MTSQTRQILETWSQPEGRFLLATPTGHQLFDYEKVYYPGNPPADAVRRLLSEFGEDFIFERYRASFQRSRMLTPLELPKGRPKNGRRKPYGTAARA